MDRSAMLLEAGMALSSELSLSAVLERIVTVATEITGARYGALGVLGPEGRITEFIATGVTDEERRAIGPPPAGRGILGLLVREGRPLRIRDVTEDPRSVGFPPNHPVMRSFLGAPIKARGKVFGNLYLTEKQGAEEFTAEDEEAVVVLATQAGVAIENAQLYEETLKRERRLEAIREVTTAILAGRDLQAVLGLIARRARELVGADLATIAVPAGDGTSLVLQAVDGAHAETLQGLTFPMEGSVSGEVVQTGRPVLLENASADDRASQPIIRLGEVGPAMFVPLSIRGRALGTLAVGNLLGGRVFDQQDLALVETFAGQTAMALEYARAQRELERLAVMEERERIAKELHDGVIQSLFAVGMGLQATASLSRDEEIAGRIEGAVADVDRVIRDLRNYIFGLRPGILADRQLDQALRELAKDFEEKSGVTTVVEIDGAVASELASRAADVVQLAREALSNVGRHAEAATCRITLRREGERAVLEIDDDGRGFDPTAAVGRGQGLRNLRDRATSLGGDVEIESGPARGTTVRVDIPV